MKKKKLNENTKLAISITVNAVILFILFGLIMYESKHYTDLVKLAEYGTFFLLALIPITELIVYSVSKYFKNRNITLSKLRKKLRFLLK